MASAADHICEGSPIGIALPHAPGERPAPVVTVATTMVVSAATFRQEVAGALAEQGLSTDAVDTDSPSSRDVIVDAPSSIRTSRRSGQSSHRGFAA